MWSPPEIQEYYVQSYAFSYRLAEGFDYYSGHRSTLGAVTLQSTTLEYVLNDLQPYGGYVIEVKSYLMPVIGSGYSGALESYEKLDNFVMGFITTVNVTHPDGKYICIN